MHYNPYKIEEHSYRPSVFGRAYIFTLLLNNNNELCVYDTMSHKTETISEFKHQLDLMEAEIAKTKHPTTKEYNQKFYDFLKGIYARMRDLNIDKLIEGKILTELDYLSMAC